MHIAYYCQDGNKPLSATGGQAVDSTLRPKRRDSSRKEILSRHRKAQDCLKSNLYMENYE